MNRANSTQNLYEQLTPQVSPSAHSTCFSVSQIPNGSSVIIKGFDTTERKYKFVQSDKPSLNKIHMANMCLTSPDRKSLTSDLQGVGHYDCTRKIIVNGSPRITSGKERMQACRLPCNFGSEHAQLYLNTFVIRHNSQLKSFIGLLSEINVIGCTMEGENVGRDGEVAWVILTAKNTLIPLDIISLSRQMTRLWEILQKHIFSNDRIVKVFHDCRPSADYLYHRHGITLLNVFDTQVAHANVERNSTGKLPACYQPLSNCLAVYVPRVPREEINYLQRFESFNFSTASPWMIRPMPPHDFLKLGALKVKHLVPLQENLTERLLKRFHKSVEAHIGVIHSKDSYYFLKNPSDLSNMVEAILLDEIEP